MFAAMEQVALRMKQTVCSDALARGIANPERDHDTALRCHIIDDVAALVGMAFDTMSQLAQSASDARHAASMVEGASPQALKEFENGRTVGRGSQTPSNAVLDEWEKRKRPAPSDIAFAMWVAGVWAGAREVEAKKGVAT